MSTAAPAAAGDPDCLTFRADQVVLDPEHDSVELSGDVEARCGSYDLRGKRIVLRAEPDQVCVEGPARLTLCPCERAPISLGFDRANLSTSGDLTLDEPSLRVGESPVFWLPWLWLRAPDRVGALPPKLAWRGDGGLLLGPGVRVPWTASDGSLAWMDLYVSGYTGGGVEVEPTIVTPSSSTTVRFDRMDGDLLRIRSRGVSRTAQPGGLAWRADLSRGARARSGLVELREAAQAFDHASAFVDVRPWSSTYVRSGMMMSGERGGAELAIGPAFFADAGGTLGAGTAWEAGGALRMLDETEGTAQLATSFTRFVVGRWLGPIRWSMDAQSSAQGMSAAGKSASSLGAWTSSEAGFPLSRRIGGGIHLVEPFVRGLLHGSTRSAEGPMPVELNAVGEGARWLTSAGVKSAFWPASGEQGGRLELSAGQVGGFSETSPSRAWIARAGTRADAYSLEGEAASVSKGDAWGGVAVARGSAGGPETVGVTAEVASRSQLDPLDARLFHPAGAPWSPVGLLSEEGTSLFVGGHVPLGGGVRWEASSDWDAGRGRWLAAGTGAVLEHPCGCLRGRAWVSRRVGRPGTDGWVTVELR